MHGIASNYMRDHDTTGSCRLHAANVNMGETYGVGYQTVERGADVGEAESNLDTDAHWADGVANVGQGPVRRLRIMADDR